METIIQQLLLATEEYFWSESEIRPGKIILGGHDGGRNFGEFEFEITDQSVAIDRSITDGVSSGQMLSTISYSSQTSEYQQIDQLLAKVDTLLKDSTYLSDRELSRIRLLENTFALLPKYSG